MTDRALRTAAVVAVVLAALSAALGLVWAAWSPTVPPAEVQPAGTLFLESEAYVAADGRFAVLTLALGLLAGVAAWFVRGARGPWMAAALGLGGLAGAWLAEVVGRAVRGHSPAIHLRGHSVAYLHWPLQVHATGLLFLEGCVAALVYGLFVAFTARDDLGRADAGRPEPQASGQQWPGAYSVAAGGHPDDGRRHGDAAGALQQREFPPQ